MSVCVDANSLSLVRILIFHHGVIMNEGSSSMRHHWGNAASECKQMYGRQELIAQALLDNPSKLESNLFLHSFASPPSSPPCWKELVDLMHCMFSTNDAKSTKHDRDGDRIRKDVTCVYEYSAFLRCMKGTKHNPDSREDS